MELFRKLFKASDGWCPNSGKPAPVKEAAQRNAGGYLIGMNCIQEVPFPVEVTVSCLVSFPVAGLRL